ncbi:MAG: bifunctional riboflavin kinase/FAD synthetase [Acidobacteria bacterium]|nr:bifunctional riboflavin kinase/FAD synthetase [Acidobacteriota bacterium]MBI3656962.1 bifunctional riboflavin kinase/FAD synthetase [Acidobacteriota bacterium]
MEVIRQLEHLTPKWIYPVLTIGNFDGLHKGHQQVIAKVVERARAQGGVSAVLTFDPHPARILSPNRAPKQIQSTEQKLATLRELGLDVVIVLPFTYEFSRWSAHDFAVKILGERIGVKDLYVGANFSFGRGRAGHVDLLEAIGRQSGFSVGTISEVYFRNLRISSTGIRRYLLNGQVSLARRVLGRPYSMRGVVTDGQKIGSKIGFPTANIISENEITPKFGVYITQIHTKGRRRPSLTNIGVRPTFTAGSSQPSATIETFVFDLDEKLYQQSVELDFCCRLRDEVRFPSKEALVAQIRKDVQLAQAYFTRVGKDSSMGPSAIAKLETPFPKT